MAHPHVDGREPELRRLVDAARRVHELAVNHLADPDRTEELAARAEAIAAGLRDHEVGLDQRFGSVGPDGDVADIFPFDIILGPYNAIGPGMELSTGADGVVGRAVFSKAYEGPPGCCHGGVLAASFDQIFNAANIVGETAGMTAELSVDYRRPTLLHTLTTFHAAIDHVDGRKVVTRGWSEQAGKITCEASGLFVVSS